jgi:hypothetical protein
MVQDIKKQKGSGIYPRGGWLVKAPEERKVKIYAYVKSKHYKEAQSLLNELAKPYR